MARQGIATAELQNRVHQFNSGRGIHFNFNGLGRISPVNPEALLASGETVGETVEGAV
jgi:hypothetical protein